MWRFHSFHSFVYVFVHLFVYVFLFVTRLLRYNWGIAKLWFSQKNIVIYNFDHKCFYTNTWDINSQERDLMTQRVNAFAGFVDIGKHPLKGEHHFTPTIHAGEGLFPQSVINMEHGQTFGFLPIRYLKNSMSV